MDTPPKVLLTIRNGEDLSEALSDYIEVYEDPPDDFCADELETPFEDSEWAGQEGKLSVTPDTFAVKFETDKVPKTATLSVDFTGWQEMYIEVGEVMHGLEYHGPAEVIIELCKIWRVNDGATLAEYKVTNVSESA